MAANPDARVLPPTPTLTSWWTRPMSREQFDAAVAREAERMNAVTTNQAVTRKAGDQ